MNKHATDIVAYLSWPGLLIAFLAGDRYASRFHLNQSLVIWVAGSLIGLLGKAVGLVARVPLLGWLVGLAGGLLCAVGGLFCGVCLFIGLVNAIQGVEKEVPVLGKFSLL